MGYGAGLERDYRLRIFTTLNELPFAGHPTLGSCHAWLEAGGVPRGEEIVQECAAGLIRIRRRGGQLAFMAPPLLRHGAVEEALLQRICRGLGIGPHTVVQARWVDNGPGWVALLGLISIIAASPGRGTTLGYGLLLISALSWSVGNVIIKQSKVREMFAFVVWASLFAPLPLLALTWLAHGSAPFTSLVSRFEWVALFSLLFQVYAATHFCYWGWNLLLREYPVSRVAPLSLLIPVFGIAGSMLMLGHKVGFNEGLAIVLILSALAVGFVKGPGLSPRFQLPGWPGRQKSARRFSSLDDR